MKRETYKKSVSLFLFLKIQSPGKKSFRKHAIVDSFMKYKDIRCEIALSDLNI